MKENAIEIVINAQVSLIKMQSIKVNMHDAKHKIAFNHKVKQMVSIQWGSLFYSLFL